MAEDPINLKDMSEPQLYLYKDQCQYWIDFYRKHELTQLPSYADVKSDLKRAQQELKRRRSL